MFSRRLAAAVAALVTAGCSGATSSPGSSLPAEPGGPRLASPPVTTSASIAATSEQLMSGRWSALPAAPTTHRDGASVVWTGSELLVWGGASGAEDHQLHADGAAYDPESGDWRLLPASPLSPRVGQAAAWTGTEMVVWGGYERGGYTPSEPTADGAAYDPTTNRWRVLPAAPLSARGDATALWTGAEVVVLGGEPGGGGQPGEVGGSPQTYGDGAAYDPSANRWQHIPAPVPPAGHPLTWNTAIQLDGELLAWSEWEINPAGGNPAGGVDLFSYSEQTGTWALIPAAAGALPDVAEALSAGKLAVVRGSPYNCGNCPGPWVPEATDLYDPAGNGWTRLPTDPLTGGLAAWTGAALFSFNPGAEMASESDPSTDVVPGDASVFDPATNGWQRLPAAPWGGCDNGLPWAPVWTGQALILYCTSSLASDRDGYVFTAGE
jgi:N-acetylneuraminic acid mutarotase